MSDKAREHEWIRNANFGDQIRMNDEKPFYEFVVTPEGRIKTCYFERNLACALLHVEYHKGQGGRVTGIARVSIPHTFAVQGYALLRDLYAQEDRLEDWDSFLLYQVQARKRHLLEPIDDDYLPDEVLRRRKEAVAVQKKSELPEPKRKRLAKTPKKAESRSSAGGLRRRVKGGKASADGSYDIQQRRIHPHYAMGTGGDYARLLAMADARDALADGEIP